MPETKLSCTDIVHKANKLVANILAWTDIQQVCREEGMNKEDAERVRKQVDNIAERLRRA